MKWLLLLFIFNIRSSGEYISLKQLCRYDDPNVPMPIQKKTYAILAPLFSQKPWDKEWKEPKIGENSSYSQLQAAYYLLIPSNFPKELTCIFGTDLFCMRQYKSFYSQDSFVPFLHNNEVWSLQNERAQLFCGVGYKMGLNCQGTLKLSVHEGFNYCTWPSDVLKTQNNSIVVCLFEKFGSISVVDLSEMKEIWIRKYSEKRHTSIVVYDDDYGELITGYNQTLCFLDQDNNTFKLYTVLDLLNSKDHSYEIQNSATNKKFEMMEASGNGSPRALNSRYLFYAFFQAEHIVQCPMRSHWNRTPIDQVSAQLYYVSYTHEPKQETVLHVLQDNDNFFEQVRCNDMSLVAKDGKGALYVWDLTQESIVLKNKIDKTESMFWGDFWLDNDSEKILTRRGVFKMQNVFEELPPIPNLVLFQSTVSAQIKDTEVNKEPDVEGGYFKKLYMRLFLFLRFCYQITKEKSLKFFGRWISKDLF